MTNNLIKGIKICIYFLYSSMSFIIDLFIKSRKKIKPIFQDPYNNWRITYVFEGKKYRYKEVINNER